LSEGGLAVALAESAISGRIGAKVNVETALRPDFALFSESQSRILLSASPDQAAELEAWIAQNGVPVAKLGTVQGDQVQIEINGKPAIQSPVAQLEKVWKDAIPCLMQ
jgi:phosphoribosylformylglycinamidine synthase